MTILIVDDDPGILNSFEVSLASQGYQAILAKNGRQALKIIKSSIKSTKPLKLMVTDFLMPGMNGIELILSARKIKPDLKFVLITAYGNSVVREKARKLGLYIEKPFAPEQLLSIIKELSSRKVP